MAIDTTTINSNYSDLNFSNENFKEDVPQPLLTPSAFCHLRTSLLNNQASALTLKSAETNKIFQSDLSTEVIEKPYFFTNMFIILGRCITGFPKIFFFIGVLISFLSIGTLKICLKDKIRDGYTADNAPSRYETEVMREFWNATGDPIMTVILAQAKNGESLLNFEALKKVQELSNFFMNDFNISLLGKTVKYSHLCYPYCDANTPLETFLMGLENELELLKTNLSLSPSNKLTYPVGFIEGFKIHLERMFFGVVLKSPDQTANQSPEQLVTNMDSIKVVLLLFRGDRSTLEKSSLLSRWELEVYNYLQHDFKSDLLDIQVIGTEILDQEMLEDGQRMVPYFVQGLVATVVFVFATVVGRSVYAGNFDLGKIWLAFATVLAPSLSITTTFGILSLLGLRINSFLLILPYLVFGIGVDDGFLIMHSWFHALKIPADSNRLSMVLVEVGPSITVTTLTNLISFGVGSFSPTPEIRLFCFGTTLALALVYVLQFFFLCPALIFSQFYESKNNRASVDEMPKAGCQPKDSIALRSISKVLDMYCRLISNRIFAFFLMCIMIVYWYFAIVGTFAIKTRLDATKILPKNSQIQKTNMILDNCVWKEYHPVTVLVNTKFDLENDTQINNFFEMLDEFERLSKCKGSQSSMVWLREYKSYVEHYEENNVFDFLDGLLDFVVDGQINSVNQTNNYSMNHLVQNKVNQATDFVNDNLISGRQTRESSHGNDTFLPKPKLNSNDEESHDRNEFKPVNNVKNEVEHKTQYLNDNLLFNSHTNNNDVIVKKETKTKKFNSCMLNEFLDSPFHRHWNAFVKLESKKDDLLRNSSTDTNCPIISRFCITIAYEDTSTWKDRITLMLQWRAIAERYAFLLNTTVWEENAMFVDQMISLKSTTIQSGALTLCCMFVICALFIPNPISVVIASCVIASICLGLFGFLSLMQYDLDPVTMAALLMSIGLSVDYTAHIAYHFQQNTIHEIRDGVFYQIPVVSKYEKLQYTMRNVGWPVIQAGISTVLCVTPMLFIQKYVANVFFDTIIMVTVLGMVHGVIFLPCMFSILPTWCSSGDFYAFYCSISTRKSYTFNEPKKSTKHFFA